MRRQAHPSHLIESNSTDLDALLDGVDRIYVYPHHQIELVDGELHQTRSGPNWEGGMVTLTTCKHLMRTYSSVTDEKKKVALIGLTNNLEGHNYLLYAGVIDMRFDSNHELGEWLRLYCSDTYRAKLATDNPRGDIYEPNATPHEDHVRYTEYSKGQRKYIKDLEYRNNRGVAPKCLTIDPVTVYTKPMYSWTGKLGRSGVSFTSVEECLSNIKEVT